MRPAVEDENEGEENALGKQPARGLFAGWGATI